MTRFWAAIVLRLVLLAYLGFVFMVHVEGVPVTATVLLTFFATIAIAAVVLMQVLAALAGYASIRSRVKESARNARSVNHGK